MCPFFKSTDIEGKNEIGNDIKPEIFVPFEFGETWIQIASPSFINCVFWGELYNLSKAFPSSIKCV